MTQVNNRPAFLNYNDLSQVVYDDKIHTSLMFLVVKIEGQ